MDKLQSEESETTKRIKELQDKDDPEAVYRLINVVIYIIILIGIGLPVWWMTTRVYRAPLPLNEMLNVEVNDQSDKPVGIPLSLEYDVLITFVNPSPQTLKVNIDGELLDINLQPFLEKISPVAKFIVKSQWLYLTPLGVNPKKVDDHFVLTEDQLPLVITPLEKKLGLHLSPRPCISLVLYVSECGKPLYIQKDSENVDYNTFLSPGWGGITILNADETSCKEKMFTPNVREVLQIFAKTVLQLFHIESIGEQDLQKFMLDKTSEMLESSRRTLKSLAQLLSEISSIVISDDVAQKINIAVNSADRAEEFLRQGNVAEALNAARESFSYSEAAFSDTSLLALLYFPDDQKYAIYIPLFLPVMIPVTMSAATILKWYKQSKEAKPKAE